MGFVKDSIISLVLTAIAVTPLGCNGAYSGQPARGYPLGQAKQPTVINSPCGRDYRCVHELYRNNDFSMGVGLGATRLPGPDGEQFATVSLVFRK